MQRQVGGFGSFVVLCHCIVCRRLQSVGKHGITCLSLMKVTLNANQPSIPFYLIVCNTVRHNYRTPLTFVVCHLNK